MHQHQLQPDSLVDLKFIMADTGFGKTFIYERIKDGTLPALFDVCRGHHPRVFPHPAKSTKFFKSL